MRWNNRDKYESLLEKGGLFVQYNKKHSGVTIITILVNLKVAMYNFYLKKTI